MEKMSGVCEDDEASSSAADDADEDGVRRPACKIGAKGDVNAALLAIHSYYPPPVCFTRRYPWPSPLLSISLIDAADWQEG